MTLDKHQLDGLIRFDRPTLPAQEFELILTQSGYAQIGSAPAQNRRVKVFWSHTVFRRVEAIYSPDKSIVITAYHT